MWESFKKNAKSNFGYSAVANVEAQDGGAKKDSQETFWLAETMKYFYLIFSPRSTLDLSKFVLNTEAHPLRVFDENIERGFNDKEWKKLPMWVGTAETDDSTAVTGVDSAQQLG